MLPTGQLADELGNDVRYDSELIATKVCSKISCKWNTTCPRTGSLLRFELNSTATSDGSAQKLCNNVWHDSESISEWFWINHNQGLQANRSQMKCDVWRPCGDQRWQDKLWFSIWRFLSNLSLSTIIYCVTDQPSITQSRRSVLISSYQFSLFWSWWAAQWALSKNCEKWKNFNSNLWFYVECNKMYWS